ncbi:MAG: putative metalloprotease CJM1_0395 family protein [Planctomycetota bacterium]
MVSGISSTGGSATQPSPERDNTAVSKAPAQPSTRIPADAFQKSTSQQYTPDEQALLRKLQQSDRAVRAHELAHQAAAGGLAGSISLSYQTGPDGKQYAIGGEVSIDTSSGNSPSATITKMQRVIASALAPGDPSSQDRAVAAQAQARIAQAQAELNKQDEQPNSLQPSSQPTTVAQPDRARRAYDQTQSQSGTALSLIA